jgi:hypothetical protein
MEEFAIRLAFLVVIAMLVAMTWRVEVVRGAVRRVAHPVRRTVVRPSRTGRAATTLRVERVAHADPKEE